MSKPSVNSNPAGKAFIGTFNNPLIFLPDFMKVLENIPGAVSGRAQLEKGKEGTPHFQWTLVVNKSTRIKKMIALMKGSHVEIARNAYDAWKYCGKDESRLDGPLEFGTPPAPSKKNNPQAREQLAERNRSIVEMGAVEACDAGYFNIEKFRQVS